MLWLPLALLAGSALSPQQAEATETRPNIVFLLTDDQRNDTLGCAGHPILQTPTIDSLAERGVRFSNMFVSHPICWVSRTTILTGLTARSSGKEDRPDHPRADAISHLYPALLKQAGYRTAHFGKFHARMPKEYDRAANYDEYVGIHRDPYFKKQADGSLRHETELIVDHAIDFVKQNPDGQPFAINLWFNAAHAEDNDHRPGIGHFPWPKAVDGMYDDVEVPAPRLSDPAIFEAMPEYIRTSLNRTRWHWRWDTPEKYQTNIRAYFRMISGIDGAVARLLKVLDDEGLADSTIIVYSADNGFYMGDRGFAGKWSHFDESIRVPLMIYDPRPSADASRGRVVDELVCNLDFAPSFLAWAGLPVPEKYQGRDLSPWLAAEPPTSWREMIFIEHVFLRPKLSWEGIRTKTHKYVRYFDQGENNVFLHALDEDPDELVNYAGAEAKQELTIELRSKLNAAVSANGGPVKDSLTD